ncbi:MAG TPA: periplasmic heavy metal sensor [Polyangia bacterium]|nr:periplasmic heavy metal sensor [Polyangia bacterium]
MIGCLIAGGLVVFALSRLFHARRWYYGHHGWGGCHSRHGGWHGGPWGHFPGRRGWGGYGLDDDDWGASLRDEGGSDGWGAGVRGKRHFIRSVLSRVNATPAQERAIGGALDEFRDDLRKLGGGEARRSRQELADALRRPTFDGVVLGEQFARHDTVIEGARKAFVGLVARVHDALEPDQRTRLASLVERGPRFGWWQ